MPDSRPLKDVKVLDFTQNLPGPYATFVLAALGATVIKVEPPRGDPARRMGGLFGRLNRGKLSVVLDLREGSADREALEGLFRWADVLVEGFRPGVMDRLGAGEAAARRCNPDIVYCSISAWGQDGPRASQPGHDLNCQAATGLCWLERDSSDMPRATVLPVADLSAALVAVASICASMAATEDRGRRLDVAMSDALLSWTSLWSQGVDLAADADRALAALPLAGLLRRLAAPLLDTLDRRKLYAMPQYGLYRCRDGHAIAIGVVDERPFWESLCDVLGLGFARKLPLSTRTVLGPVLRRAVAARVARFDAVPLVERLEAADVPVTLVESPGAACRDPQFLARGLVDERGEVRAPVPGAAALDGPAPALGEHTAEVLSMVGRGSSR